MMKGLYIWAACYVKLAQTVADASNCVRAEGKQSWRRREILVAEGESGVRLRRRPAGVSIESGYPYTQYPGGLSLRNLPSGDVFQNRSKTLFPIRAVV